MKKKPSRIRNSRGKKSGKTLFWAGPKNQKLKTQNSHNHTQNQKSMVHPSPAADDATWSLPQPPGASSSIDNVSATTARFYAYVPFDVLDADWLGDPRRLKLKLLRQPTQTSSSSSSSSSSSLSSMTMNRNDRGGVDECVNDRSEDREASDRVLARRYSPGTLVWVLLSRGGRCHNRRTNDTAPIRCGGGDALALHKKRRDKKNKRRVIDDVDSRFVNDGDGDENGRDDEGEEEAKENDESNVAASMNYSRKEFFRRARVVSDDESFAIPSSSLSSTSNEGSDAMGHGMREDGRDRRRVLVRYSGGSTYRVRAYNLVPVLESRLHTSMPGIVPPLVVVVPETNIYRRVAKVHTAPGDAFLEIGCDYGITVDRVRCSLASGGDVPLEQLEYDTKMTAASVGGENDECADGCIDNRDGDGEALCVGVDKSIESIDIANRR